jgi:hypothetical protein
MTILVQKRINQPGFDEWAMRGSFELSKGWDGAPQVGYASSWHRYPIGLHR